MGRRTHATIGAKNVDMKSISQQMGHSNISMTGIYISKDDEKLKKLFDFIEPKDSIVSNNKKANSNIPEMEEDIEVQLLKLKTLYEKGMLEKDTYDDRVDLLLDKFGFK
jgi:hypothetical protein